MLASVLRTRPACLASISLFLAGLVVSLLPAPAFAASGPYSSGTVGYDISYPNCSQSIMPKASNGSPYSFAIVGVSDGRAFSSNPCLAAEFGSASGLSNVGLYMNLNSPIGSTAREADLGPKSCSHQDKVCKSYNYGYQAALSALSTAASANAKAGTWWLDVETGNSWSQDQAANFAVIQGASDALVANNVANVGVYSTAAMWSTITGTSGAQSIYPVWTAPGPSSLAAGAGFCGASFTKGPVWLVQYSGGSYDEDYAC